MSAADGSAELEATEGGAAATEASGKAPAPEAPPAAEEASAEAAPPGEDTAVLPTEPTQAENGAEAQPAEPALAHEVDAPAPAPGEGGDTGRRRSRWGSKKDGDATADGADAAADAPAPARKRSRWGSRETKQTNDPVTLMVHLGLPLATLQQMTAEQQQSLPALKEKMEEIDLLLSLPDCGVSEIPTGRRSPSPDPIFDKHGQRVNSRSVRRRQKLESERVELLNSLKPKVPQRSWRKLMDTKELMNTS